MMVDLIINLDVFILILNLSIPNAYFTTNIVVLSTTDLSPTVLNVSSIDIIDSATLIPSTIVNINSTKNSPPIHLKVTPIVPNTITTTHPLSYQSLNIHKLISHYY